VSPPLPALRIVCTGRAGEELLPKLAASNDASLLVDGTRDFSRPEGERRPKLKLDDGSRVIADGYEV
jgi:hypothetical protein